MISLGAGFGGTLYSDYYYQSRWPAFSLSYERRLTDNLFNDKSALGLGVVIGYTTCTDESSLMYEDKSTDYLGGIRLSMYYRLMEKLDIYAGVMGGYNLYERTALTWNNWDVTTSNDRGGEAAYAVFVGARYHILNFAGVFAEVGYGYTYLNAGLSFRF